MHMSVWGVLGLKAFFAAVATDGESINDALDLAVDRQYTLERHTERARKIYNNGRAGTCSAGSQRSKNGSGKSDCKEL